MGSLSFQVPWKLPMAMRFGMRIGVLSCREKHVNIHLIVDETGLRVLAHEATER